MIFYHSYHSIIFPLLFLFVFIFSVESMNATEEEHKVKEVEEITKSPPSETPSWLNSKMMIAYIACGILAVAAATALFSLFMVKRNRRRKYFEMNSNNEVGKLPSAATTTTAPSPIIKLPSSNDPTSVIISPPQTDKPKIVVQVPFLRGIRIIHVLGSGIFGEVYVGVWNNETRVALKLLKGPQFELFQKHSGALFGIGTHPSLVAPLGLYNDVERQKQYVVMEFMELGSLQPYLKEHKEELKTSDLFSMISSAAKGMAYLSEKGVIHCNLSARNLFVYKKDEKYEIKISDYGISKSLISTDGSPHLMDFGIAVRWMPPEVLKEGGNYVIGSDVWSFGVVIWEILEHGGIPYNALSNREVIEKIPEGTRLPKPSLCSDPLWEIISSCWKTNPSDRPIFAMIIEQLDGLISHRLSYSKEEGFTRSISHQLSTYRFDPVQLDDGAEGTRTSEPLKVVELTDAINDQEASLSKFNESPKATLLNSTNEDT